AAARIPDRLYHRLMWQRVALLSRESPHPRSARCCRRLRTQRPDQLARRVCAPVVLRVACDQVIAPRPLLPAVRPMPETPPARTSTRAVTHHVLRAVCLVRWRVRRWPVPPHAHPEGQARRAASRCRCTVLPRPPTHLQLLATAGRSLVSPHVP